MKYGTATCLSVVTTSSVVEEVLTLVGVAAEADFPSAVQLSLKSQTRRTGIGLLGGSRNSALATRVGLFAYIPPPLQAGAPISPIGQAGVLVLGETSPPSLDRNCRDGEPIQWIGVVPTGSMGHWVVPGTLSVAEAPGVPVSWVVDTGATALYLSQSTYRALMDRIQDSGSIVGEFEGKPTPISKCEGFETRFPNIEISVGDAIAVVITPEEYIKVPEDGSLDSCVAMIDPSGIPDLPSFLILGMTVLRKLVTVFDAREDAVGGSRVGFCHVRPAKPSRGPLSRELMFPLRNVVIPLHEPIGWAEEVRPHQPEWILKGFVAVVTASGMDVDRRIGTMWSLDLSAKDDSAPLVIPSRSYIALVERITESRSATSGYLPVGEMLVRIDNCFDAQARFPTIVLAIVGNGVPPVHIHPNDYLTDMNDDLSCLLNVLPSAGGLIPLSSRRLREHFVVIDTQKKSLGIAAIIGAPVVDPRGVVAGLRTKHVSPSVDSFALPFSSPLIHSSPLAADAPMLDLAIPSQGWMTFSLSFGTTSRVSSMTFAGVLIASRREVAAADSPITPSGYLDVGARRVGDHPRRTELTDLPIIARVEEELALGASWIRMPISLDLVDPGIGSSLASLPGILAGDRLSELALQFGTFTILADRGGTGRVLVGERREDVLLTECARWTSSLTWVRLIPGRTWSVWGSVRDHAVSWTMDSTYTGIQLFDETFNDIRDVLNIAAGGYGILPSGYPPLHRLGRCDEVSMMGFPSIELRIGKNYDPAGMISYTVRPEDYVVVQGGDCFSRLQSAGASTIGVSLKLGLPFMHKFVTVFDAERDRMGFCPKKP